MPCVQRRLIFDRAADCLDGARVGIGIACGVGIGTCAFAEHVEGAERERGVARAAREGFVNAATDHEFATDDLHRATERVAHDRLGDALTETTQPTPGVGRDVARQIHQLAGEHQTPGRSVDEQRARATRMGIPMTTRDFFGNQAIGGLVVGNSQQRLGEAHERDTLLVGEPEFLQEGVEIRTFVGAPPSATNQRVSRGEGCSALLRRQRGQQGVNVGGFIA